MAFIFLTPIKITVYISSSFFCQHSLSGLLFGRDYAVHLRNAKWKPSYTFRIKEWLNKQYPKRVHTN